MKPCPASAVCASIQVSSVICIAKEFGLEPTLGHCTKGHLIAEEIVKSGYPAIVGPTPASRTKDEVAQSDFKTPCILKNLPGCGRAGAERGWFRKADGLAQ